MTRSLPFMIALALASTAACANTSDTGTSSPSGGGGDGDPHPLKNKAGPEFGGDLVNGKGKISFASKKGKVLIVDFWATWCEPCKKSFPKLQDLYVKYKGQMEIIGISEDEENNGLKSFADANGSAKFPIIFDDGKTIAAKWQPSKMPSTFIIDKNGVVKFVHLGYHDGEEADIERQVKGLL
jgi:cytochrome c biogenesis protein CcmG/thiol:disulfide interchange protein DsbE